MAKVTIIIEDTSPTDIRFSINSDPPFTDESFLEKPTNAQYLTVVAMTAVRTEVENTAQSYQFIEEHEG